MLSIGKIPNDILKKIIFKYLGAKNNDIIDGPHISGDSAVVNFQKNNYIALKSDPITGAFENIGKHAIIVNSNDIAARGGIPKFFLATILLPPGSTIDDLEQISKDLHATALKLNISIIGGHSEVTNAVKSPIVLGVMAGEIKKDRFLDAKNIEVGDKIILTKSIGIEGCSVIANDHYNLIKDQINSNVINKAKKLIDKISILQEAQIALKNEGLKFMHDPTEGGLLGGIIELCSLINKGFILYESDIPIYDYIDLICKKLEINPLRLLSSGALIIICKPEYCNKMLNDISNSGINAKIIGEITESGYKIKLKNGKIKNVNPDTHEELWNIDQ
ncbi:MAG: AIR synthase family protein [Candidatus Helarchaeota archaeon]